MLYLIPYRMEAAAFMLDYCCINSVSLPLQTQVCQERSKLQPGKLWKTKTAHLNEHTGS